jgi:hypothetical protein
MAEIGARRTAVRVAGRPYDLKMADLASPHTADRGAIGVGLLTCEERS